MATIKAIGQKTQRPPESAGRVCCILCAMENETEMELDDIAGLKDFMRFNDASFPDAGHDGGILPVSSSGEVRSMLPVLPSKEMLYRKLFEDEERAMMKVKDRDVLEGIHELLGLIRAHDDKIAEHRAHFERTWQALREFGHKQDGWDGSYAQYRQLAVMLKGEDTRGEIEEGVYQKGFEAVVEKCSDELKTDQM